jgi:hypothetical protein
VRAPLALLLSVLVLAACTRSPSDSPSEAGRRTDTLSQYDDGTPQRVVVAQGDSVLEQRTYRPSGRLSKVVAGDSVRTFLDFYEPDSAAVLRDYLQGRWRNLSADTSRPQSSAFYVFENDRLTFETPSRTPLESLSVTYEDGRTLVTDEGMSVRATIAAFDTVRVTGYTLVRLPDSLQ